MPQSARKTKDTLNEFVVGGSSAFYRSQNNASGDRVETRLTPEMIDRLRLDSEIESDVSLLFDSVISDGIEIVSAVTDEEDAEFAEAQEIADFMCIAIETERNLESVVKEMAKSAFYYGVKVGEIVLKYKDDSRVQGKLVLDRINTKPNSATAFVTDKFYNVLGLLGAKRPNQPVVSVSSVDQDEIIRRDKFLILTFELEDNDPRGLSQVRSLVDDYCEKRLTKEQWKEWRRTSAIPKKVGITPEKAEAIQLKDANGNVVLENGVPKTVSAQKGLMTALEGYANNSTVVVPFGSDVKQLEVQGTGVQFLKPIQYNDSKMRKVVLGDSLVTGEADKDARAARESSKDVSDIRKQALRTVIENAVRRDVFRLITVVNFGEEKAHLTPKCFLGDTESTDWATDLTAAKGAGYKFADEHMRVLDAQFGMPPRSDDADAVDVTPPTIPNQEEEEDASN